MKYTQNKKIEQVNESTLIIGADIAKQKHIARAQDFRGIEFGRALTFDNSRDGFMGSQHFFGQFAKPLLKGARFPSASATVWG
jgi:hypothetical protein